MKRNAFSKVIAILVSAQLMMAMFPLLAFAEIGSLGRSALQGDASGQIYVAANAIQADSESPLAVGVADELVTQAGKPPAGEYLVTVEPQGDSTCSYNSLRIRVFGENNAVLYESYEVSPDPDSPWDPQDFSFTVDVSVKTPASSTSSR